jgi:hypothetical protein
MAKTHAISPKLKRVLIGNFPQTKTAASAWQCGGVAQTCAHGARAGGTEDDLSVM